MRDDYTKQQAKALHDSGFWRKLDHHERARFQLWQRRLCMPWSVFHEAMTVALGRPVYTHEFVSKNLDGLQAELLGDASPPTVEELLAMIPKDKRVLVLVP